jgi:hypothetical protein
MAADGHPNQDITMQCEVTSPAITHSKKRFVAHGLAGLHDEARPGRPRAHDDEAVTKLLVRVLHEKPDGATHWSVRSAAAQTAISKSSVARYLSLFGVQPHRSKNFKLSNDPYFVEKVRDIVGLLPESADQCSRAEWRGEEPMSGAGPCAADVADGACLSRRGDA